MKALTTVVVRSAHKGESHGAMFLVDLNGGAGRRVLDWSCDIDWTGRGADRGLRGIAFHEGSIFVAASDAIVVLDERFRTRRVLRNRYLKHCHEIAVIDDLLWVTSTAYDALLGLDLAREHFVHGFTLRLAQPFRYLNRIKPLVVPRVTSFDPESDGGPFKFDTLHLNNVFGDRGGIVCSGTGLPWALRLTESGRPSIAARTPFGTHNVQPYRNGYLMNHTRDDAVRHASPQGKTIRQWPVPRFRDDQLESVGLSNDYARASFARGLCVAPDGTIIGGSSPATITRYDGGWGKPPSSVNLSMDIRLAIHGLEISPYH